MTRKKVKLAYIANDSARKATLKKRKKGLMNKVRELSTLCGVEACAILCSPYDSTPEVWPDQAGVQRVLNRFRGMPEMEQTKKMVNQESFLRQRIAKASEQLKKQRKDNREKEVTQVMLDSLGRGEGSSTMMDLNDLGLLMEQNIKEIDRRLETLNSGPHDQLKESNSSNVIGVTSKTGGGGGRNYVVERLETTQKQQCLTDFMKPEEHVRFGGDALVLPFRDNNNHPLWPNIVNFFP